jgi:thioredoxin 1
MKKTLVLAGVVSIALVLGCGKKSEENIAEKRIEHQTGSKEQAKPIEVRDDNFESEVLKSDIPVLVDFWAPWCRPCLIAAPVLEKIAQQYQGRLKVCKLNVDEARQTAMRYGIRSIPTLNIYKHGEVVDQMIGVTPNYEFDLKKKIESHL